MKEQIYHVDIMDGHFVKNITLSPDFVKAISPVTKLPLDCHLMVTDPDDYIDSLAQRSRYICPHAKQLILTLRIINRIKNAAVVGVVLNRYTTILYKTLYSSSR